jgi:hypothetical protein
MRDAKCKEQYKFMKSVHFNDDGMKNIYRSLKWSEVDKS